MSQLSELMDQVRPDLEPLATHSLAKEETIVKERYLVLLLASLLENGALTEPQTRLLEMLLTSIQGVQSLVFYLQQAAKLDKKELLISLEMLGEKKKRSNAFIFDLLLLMRVSGIPSVQSMRQLSWLVATLKFTDDEIYKLIYCCILLLNGTVDMDEKPCLCNITPRDFVIKDIVSEGWRNNVILKPNGSLYSSKKACINEIEKEENSVFSSKKWILTNKSPFKKGCLLHAGNFVFRATKVGAYKVFDIPTGLIVNLYKMNWSSDSWESKGAVAKMLTFPNGLDAWLPLFESKE